MMSNRWTLASVPQFFRFGFVGCIGFCVDTVVLYGAIYLLGVGPYWGRLLSYLAAATSTWYLNRIITFGASRNQGKAKEWLKFVLCNGLGGAINYGTYATYLHFLDPSTATPVIGVAMGSCAGLIVNYTLSRHLVFARPNPASTIFADDALPATDAVSGDHLNQHKVALPRLRR